MARHGGVWNSGDVGKGDRRFVRGSLGHHAEAAPEHQGRPRHERGAAPNDRERLIEREGLAQVRGGRLVAARGHRGAHSVSGSSRDWLVTERRSARRDSRTR